MLDRFTFLYQTPHLHYPLSSIQCPAVSHTVGFPQGDSIQPFFFFIFKVIKDPCKGCYLLFIQSGLLMWTSHIFDYKNIFLQTKVCA